MKIISRSKFLKIALSIFFVVFVSFLQPCIAQTATVPSVGDGSESDPYQITTWENLYWISQNTAEWDKYFIQTTDIDLSTANPAINTWDSNKGWPMIGSYTSLQTNTPFTGSYNGNGHTISELYINRSSTDGVALFAYTEGASIQNLGLVNVAIVGNEFVSALVGRTGLSTSISNCFSTGSISSDSYYGYVGGLIGYHSGSSSILNSYSKASITGTRSGGTQSLGGLIGGAHTSSVTNCYSTGAVSGGLDYFGGLIGYSIATITNCFWDTQTSGQTTSSGGATGKTTDEMQTASLFIQADWDFMDESVNGEDDLWGINSQKNDGYPFLAWQGYLNDAELRLSTEQVSDISTAKLSATANGTIYSLGASAATQYGVCWNTTGSPTLLDSHTENGTPSTGSFTSQMTALTHYEVYYVRSYATNGSVTVYGNEVSFAMISAVAPSVGIGTSSSPYEIANIENLLWLSENQSVWGNGKYFNQTTNIDASVTQFIDEGRGFSPIGIYNLDAFQGNYNGQGYTIDGLYINRTEHDYNALFGSLNSSAIIQNLGLTNADISGKGVAALVGCVYSSYVTINNCYATGSVTSIDGYTGGLVAYLAYGTMSNCYSNVAVLGLSYSGALVGRIQGGEAYNSYSLGSISKTPESTSISYVGGFAGAIDASAVVSNCYSIASVGTGNDVGGFVAYYNSSTLTNCFWDTETSGQATSYAGTGKTSAEMKVYPLFYSNSWDFKGETTNGTNGIWNIGNDRNDGYPYLNWQYPDDPTIFLTWTGNTSTDWDNTENWNYEIIPTEINHVSIPNVSNAPQINTVQNCNDLVLESGALLTINPTGILNVSSTLTNNAGSEGLVISSDENGTGKLLNNTPGVEATLEQFITDDGWHYISFPFTENITLMPSFKGFWITENDENTATSGVESGWSYLTGTDHIVSGKGYGFYHNLDTTITINGTLNTGEKVVNTTFGGEGWNLIANPYPCTIDWEEVNENLTNVNDAIYLWNPTLSGDNKYGRYGTYNDGIVVNGQTQYISPMQAFFVKATAAGSLTFTDAAKTTEASTFKSAVVQSVMRLELRDGQGYSDESVIRLHPAATENFDGHLDAYKLKANSLAPQLYSVYNGHEYAINSLPKVSEETIIPLELMVKTTGKHTLALTELNAFNYAYPLVLLNGGGEVLAYLETEDYTFEAEAGQTLQLSLAFSNVVLVNEALQQNLFIVGENQQILIGRMAHVPSEVSVYNVSGQMVYHKRNVETNELLIPLNKHGVYLVKIQPKKGSLFIEKVMLK
ncbi:MAG TPA: GLUG motif-containing protein [Prolixibacteraceae bacterium]|nr:GLUG motif-containing protein [Prolixibacteraceae bacterium]